MKMNYDRWMKDTAAFGRVRSTELKAVDTALKSYEQAAISSGGSVLTQRRALQQALEKWKDSQKAKGQDWRSSVRNKLKSVELLDTELGHVIAGVGGLNHRGELMIDPAELAAQKVVADAIRKNTATMFKGQKLTVKNTKLLADINDVRKELNSFKNTARQITSGASAASSSGTGTQVSSLLRSLFGEAGIAEVQVALGPLYAEVLASVTPFIGAIKSGGSALLNWGKAAKQLYSTHKMKESATSFAPGDPAAAFDAVMLIMNRETTTYASSASIYTVSAGAKAAFTAADFGAMSGPLLGAAEQLALVVQKIYLFARDWNEMKDANELLQQARFDLTLFKANPLVGCYLIANSDTSAVINMAVADFGRPGWKFEVEVVVKKAQPVFSKAREVIRESRFEFAGMQGMKGTVADRTATTLGIPTGKLAGLLEDVKKRINRAGN
jgi:hypothetical protein